MKVTALIESAECKFKQILEGFFISVYDEKSLPSHGIDHHRRVWTYAKELLEKIYIENISADPSLPENLIIACYLHDIGMSVDPGIKHGHHSRELCKKFLAEYNFDETNYNSLLSAIESHDNKEYKTSSAQNNLLAILSAADDLDAFGFIGIYRYSEIYLKRGVNPEDIGSVILKNAGHRFDNFKRTFSSLNSVVLKQYDRYKILEDFFNNYNSQVQSYVFDGHNPTGYCGVVECISEMIKTSRELEAIFSEIENIPDDKVIIWYFRNLNSELTNFKFN